MTIDENTMLSLLIEAAELLDTPMQTPEVEKWLKDYNEYMDRDDDEPIKPHYND